MRGMEWENKVWIALKDAVSGMPPFVRGKALRKIILAAEDECRDKGAICVVGEDLWKAVDVAVPALVRRQCKAALRESGL